MILIFQFLFQIDDDERILSQKYKHVFIDEFSCDKSALRIIVLLAQYLEYFWIAPSKDFVASGNVKTLERFFTPILLEINFRNSKEINKFGHDEDHIDAEETKQERRKYANLQKQQDGPKNIKFHPEGKKPSVMNKKNCIFLSDQGMAVEACKNMRKDVGDGKAFIFLVRVDHVEKYRNPNVNNNSNESSSSIDNRGSDDINNISTMRENQYLQIVSTEEILHRDREAGRENESYSSLVKTEPKNRGNNIDHQKLQKILDEVFMKNFVKEHLIPIKKCLEGSEMNENVNVYINHPVFEDPTIQSEMCITEGNPVEFLRGVGETKDKNRILITDANAMQGFDWPGIVFYNSHKTIGICYLRSKNLYLRAKVNLIVVDTYDLPPADTITQQPPVDTTTQQPPADTSTQQPPADTITQQPPADTSTK